MRSAIAVVHSLGQSGCRRQLTGSGGLAGRSGRSCISRLRYSRFLPRDDADRHDTDHHAPNEAIDEPRCKTDLQRIEVLGVANGERLPQEARSELSKQAADCQPYGPKSKCRTNYGGQRSQYSHLSRLSAIGDSNGSRTQRAISHTSRASNRRNSRRGQCKRAACSNQCKRRSKGCRRTTMLK